MASGFAARGIEPSSPLQAIAAQRGLPVTHGVLPNSELPGPFDVVTLIDVIEHVPDPVDLVRRIKSVMAPNGIFVVVTPDVDSVAARLMGWKWWHFRAAHIGYFNRSTLGPGVGEGRAKRQRDHAAVVAPAFEPPGEEGVQLPFPAVSAASADKFWIGLLFRSICMIRFCSFAGMTLRHRRSRPSPEHLGAGAIMVGSRQRRHADVISMEMTV